LIVRVPEPQFRNVSTTARCPKAASTGPAVTAAPEAGQMAGGGVGAGSVAGEADT
jgi:hypothetical protein